MARKTEVRAADKPIARRTGPEGVVPLLSVEGTLQECGIHLGAVWKEVLQLEAEHAASDKPWWKDRRYTPLISKYAPHLPDLYRAMAAGAGVKEDLVAPRAPQEKAGCTSFAIAPEATLEGVPISGQSKDVGYRRGLQLMVLRVKMSDAPSMLTLTYPGWLFGHGFVKGGTSVFRNSLFVADADRGLPYGVWGILALHCPTVEDVIEMTRRYGIASAAHAAIADERGGIVGIESGKGGVVFLRPKHGVYTHANCVISGPRLRRWEKGHDVFHRADSLHRTARLRERLEADVGRLTPQLAYGAMSDHDGYPVSICRHESRNALTASCVIVEPARGLLHATRGAACHSWPTTFRL